MRERRRREERREGGRESWVSANMHIFKISHPHNQKMLFFCYWWKIYIFFFTAQSGRRGVRLSFLGWKLLSVRAPPPFPSPPPPRQHCVFPFISGREQSDIVSFLWRDKAKQQQQQQQKRKTHIHTHAHTMQCDDGGG